MLEAIDCELEVEGIMECLVWRDLVLFLYGLDCALSVGLGEFDSLYGSSCVD